MFTSPGGTAGVRVLCMSSLRGCESIETLGKLMSRLGDSPGFTLLSIRLTGAVAQTAQKFTTSPGLVWVRMAMTPD